MNKATKQMALDRAYDDLSGFIEELRDTTPLHRGLSKGDAKMLQRICLAIGNPNEKTLKAYIGDNIGE
jgi:hypothetical protein